MLAESFATLVSLIGQYFSEKESRDQVEFNDFMAWLIKKNHHQVKTLIDQNIGATNELRSLLKEDHKMISEKLEKIERAITSYASTIQGFDSLAKAINPTASLSKQAVSILEQFRDARATRALEMKLHGFSIFQFTDASGKLDLSEPQFAADDFNQLIKLGLLLHEYNGKGGSIYVLTRAASDLVKN
ncbi:hypothetical protein [Methylophilus sp. 5]|uniref:hypothetical protein n=1 Tax=Methylophilus sp. 5 TaxID=1112274 RepID=UPI00048D530C|nr:hypothetical protein [Methylophilus sp. 5]